MTLAPLVQTLSRPYTFQRLLYGEHVANPASLSHALGIRPTSPIPVRIFRRNITSTTPDGGALGIHGPGRKTMGSGNVVEHSCGV
jgi:hypothetical protein